MNDLWYVLGPPIAIGLLIVSWLLVIWRRERRPHVEFCTGCGTQIEWRQWESNDFDARTGRHVWRGQWICPHWHDRPGAHTTYEARVIPEPAT